MRALRENRATADVPVVVLTGSAVPRRQSNLIGATHVLHKPAVIASLARLIGDAVDQSDEQSHRQTSRSAGT